MNEIKYIIKLYSIPLIKNWYIIVGTGILFAVISYYNASQYIPVYESTALVLLRQSSINLELSENIREGNYQQPSYGYPEIALSDELLEIVINDINSTDITSIEDLKGKLSANLHRDTTLLKLEARDTDAETSTMLVNIWAENFVEWVNDKYRKPDEKQLFFYVERLQEAQGVLEKIEQESVEFASQNRLSLISNEHNRLDSLQKRLLTAREDIQFLIKDIDSMKSQLTNNKVVSNVTLADQLTAMSLQSKVFNATTGPDLSIQFDPSDELAGQNKQEITQLLDSFEDILLTRLEEIDDELSLIESKLLDYQFEIKKIQTDSERLQRREIIATEVYMTLVRQVEEERFKEKETSGDLLLASKATVPNFPRTINSYTNTLLSIVTGIVLSSGIILIIFWWRQD